MATKTYNYFGTRTDKERLLKAIIRNRPVTIRYRKADGTVTLRTVEPYDVGVSQHGDELLYAMDRESGGTRSWRFDRIEAYRVHDGRQRIERA